MNDKETLKVELEKVFEAIGVSDPASWARSQVEEGIPQLARAVFLLKAWTALDVILDSVMGEIRKHRNEQVTVVPDALRPLIREGLRRFLFKLCVLLEDPEAVSLNVSDAQARRAIDGVVWGLFLIDEEKDTVIPITGLEESVHETDPMRTSRNS